MNIIVAYDKNIPGRKTVVGTVDKIFSGAAFYVTDFCFLMPVQFVKSIFNSAADAAFKRKITFLY